MPLRPCVHLRLQRLQRRAQRPRRFQTSFPVHRDSIGHKCFSRPAVRHGLRHGSGRRRSCDRDKSGFQLRSLRCACRPPEGSLRTLILTFRFRQTGQKYAALSAQEIEDCIREKGYNVDAGAFFDYYEANGWKQAGGNPIQKWKAALSTWNRRGGDLFNSSKSKVTSPSTDGTFKTTI